MRMQLCADDGTPYLEGELPVPPYVADSPPDSPAPHRGTAGEEHRSAVSFALPDVRLAMPLSLKSNMLNAEYCSRASGFKAYAPTTGR
jgi:hypothetical protein